MLLYAVSPGYYAKVPQQTTVLRQVPFTTTPSPIRYPKMSNGSDTFAELQQLAQDQGDLKKQLAIIRISEPISDVGDLIASPSKRGSDVSLSNLNDPTPAVLEADLTHYKVPAISAAFSPSAVTTDNFATNNRNSSPNFDSPTSSRLPKKSSSEQSSETRPLSSDTMRTWRWKHNWRR